MSSIGNVVAAIWRLLGGKSSLLSTSITVSTSDTVIFSIQVPGKYRIGISNTGATATNTFKIQGRNLESGTFKDIVSTSTQFTTIPNSISRFLLASDDTITPTALTGGQEWFGAIDTFAYDEVRAISTVATGTTTLSVRVD